MFINEMNKTREISLWLNNWLIFSTMIETLGVGEKYNESQ